MRARRVGSKLSRRSSKRWVGEPGPAHVPPDGGCWQGRKRPHGQGLPRATGTAATKNSQLEPREGQEQKASKGKGRESWMVAVRPRRPSQPQVTIPRHPGPSTTSEAGAGRLGGGGGPPCRSARRLLPARRAPGWLSLHGSLVLRSLVGRRPQGSPPAPPFRAAHRGATVAMIPAAERGCGGPSPASRGRGP